MAADNAELEIEETIPEIESMMGVVFEEDDKRRIVSQRRIHETRHRHKRPTKESLIKFINFELRLLRLIHLRQQRVACNPLHKGKVTTLEMCIKKRLNRLFLAGLRIFSKELKLWIAFLRFCRQHHMYSDGSRVLPQLLAEHGRRDHELYLMAADWEAEHCRNLDQARVYLMRGAHQHRDNKDLLRAAFRLELTDTAHRRKECLASGETINPANPLLTTANAELIFEGSIKKLGDVEMMNELLKLSTSYDFTDRLYKKINDAIFECKNDERMWHIIAQRELNDSDSSVSPKDQIKQCVALYDKAVKLLNTHKMWGYYLDSLLEINKDLAVLPNYKRKLLLAAFQRCANIKKLDKKYYLLWVGYLQGADKYKKLVEMLSQAVKNVPDCVELWATLLKTHLSRGDEKAAHGMFDLAVNVLGNKGLPLWRLMIEFELLKTNNKVDWLYRRGIEMSLCPEVGRALKPLYLDWLVLSQGIQAARKAYDQQIGQPPLCLQLHLKMAALEKIQPCVNTKRVRVCYTYAIVEFPTNFDVWVEFCKFEMEYESHEKLNELLAEAAKRLDQNNYDALRVEMSIAQSMAPPALFIDHRANNDMMIDK